MSSLAGRFGYPSGTTYSAAKGCLVGFTKTLTLKLSLFSTIRPGRLTAPGS